MVHSEAVRIMHGTVNPYGCCVSCVKKAQVYLTTPEGNYFCKKCFSTLPNRQYKVDTRKFTNKDLICFTDGMRGTIERIKREGVLIEEPYDVINFLVKQDIKGVNLGRVKLTRTKSYLRAEFTNNFGETVDHILTIEGEIAKLLFLIVKGRT